MQSIWWDFWNWPLPVTAFPPFFAAVTDTANFSGTLTEEAASTSITVTGATATVEDS